MPKKVKKSSRKPKKATTRKKVAPSTNRTKRPDKRSSTQVDPASVRSFGDLPEDVPLKLVGLIAPDGGGGGSSDGRGKIWTFSADLAAWKLKGGSVVHESALIVSRKISERKLSALMKSASNLGIIEFEARRPAASKRPKSYPQPVRFELIRLGKKVRDARLQKIKNELQKSVEYRDAVFGVLKLDREHRQFEGKAAFRGTDMIVSFETESLDELKDLIRYAKVLWKNRQSWFSDFRNAAYEHYVEEMEAAWWDGEGELTRAKFNRLLGWPVTAEFRSEDGEYSYCLGGWSEELYTDHGVDAFGTDADSMEIQT